MIILGIDPGTLIMGYGVIESDDTDISPVDFGALVCTGKSPMSERLINLYRDLIKIIRQHQPDVIAIEQPFIGKNVRTAMAIGRAQAISLLAAASEDIPAFEYTPRQVKQNVANYGASSKEQIQEMVRLQLGLEQIPEPNDAADALAVAICHVHEAHLQKLLNNGQGMIR
jgi:crossover junction endodeoxyribonuclease RuvC